ncbi:alpha-amylase family glycosyl hydrolase [Streptomyces sp. DSM 44915]|uniref:Alpha-amylase family glycosyl hydrolase n=1 Tax=Streptomyces chisholmiae TaxID=3075540 RepID=A0ABU2K0K8_9ACTN|nr:alpha-amylase family glycosyl hydrolase [Streptomyces sp. DSM 44915]MDT0270319.1 alpha-amylase family glycosyl hydrolase [Streptomyces sp. DSM 44915]
MSASRDPAAAPGGLRAEAGTPAPLGATVVDGGVNFAVATAPGRRVVLVLCDPADGAVTAELPFPAEPHHGPHGDVHAMTVRGPHPALSHYGYRVEPGPATVLLDPYARELAGTGPFGTRPAYRSVVPDPEAAAFDWGDDRRPRHPAGDLVLYELHVRGFTRDPSSGVAHPGTYAGLREKLPYLAALGVTAVELLPVFEFDETDNTYAAPGTGEPLPNYWGYNTVAFLAPKAGYAADRGPGGPARELKELVRACHAAGIEVILDVVLNHTAEGDHRGPTLSFRALHEAAYYLLDADGRHRNLTATGNTVNANHPVASAFLLDCLRHWATEYHVDGFRFDMASILTRGTDGAVLEDPPLVRAIATDPVLADLRLIAEASDAAGTEQVGSFPHFGRWSEWNMRYRDTIRRFLLGRPGSTAAFATRLVGSPDLYPGRGAAPSINYVTCHDGFTLADLTAYDHRHNAANGEGGGDGIPGEDSWNHGHEGPTDDPAIRALRARQARNALLLLLTSRGVPMLLAGDEHGRTQGGNNNAYSQDNPTSWLDWSLADAPPGAALLRFTRRCLAFRRAHPVLRRLDHPEGRRRPGAPHPPVSWHGETPDQPDWSAASTLLAVLLHDEAADDTVYLAANTGDAPRTVRAPAPPPGRRWHVFADTAAPPGADAHPPGAEPPCPDPDRLTLPPRATTLLVAHPL